MARFRNTFCFVRMEGRVSILRAGNPWVTAPVLPRTSRNLQYAVYTCHSFTYSIRNNLRLPSGPAGNSILLQLISNDSRRHGKERFLFLRFQIPRQESQVEVGECTSVVSEDEQIFQHPQASNTWTKEMKPMFTRTVQLARPFRIRQYRSYLG